MDKDKPEIMSLEDEEKMVQKQYRETEGGKIAVDRYNKSDKGKASRKKYWASDKGKLTRKKYYESGLGQEGYQRRQEESKELRRLLKWIGDNPDRDPREFYSPSPEEDDSGIDIEVQKEGEEVNLDNE